MKKLLLGVALVIAIVLVWSSIEPKDVPSNYKELIIGDWVVTNEKYVDCEDCWVDYTSEEWYTPDEWSIRNLAISMEGRTYMFNESDERRRFLVIDADLWPVYEIKILKVSKEELIVYRKETEHNYERWYKLKRK